MPTERVAGVACAEADESLLSPSRSMVVSDVSMSMNATHDSLATSASQVCLLAHNSHLSSLTAANPCCIGVSRLSHLSLSHDSLVYVLPAFFAQLFRNQSLLVRGNLAQEAARAFLHLTETNCIVCMHVVTSSPPRPSPPNTHTNYCVCIPPPTPRRTNRRVRMTTILTGIRLRGTRTSILCMVSVVFECRYLRHQCFSACLCVLLCAFFTRLPRCTLAHPAYFIAYPSLTPAPLSS